MTKQKAKDLTAILLVYLIAFAAGYLSCFMIKNTMLQFFVFDTAATVVTFIFSVIYHNSSVYDAYWSFTPMLMSVWLFVQMQALSVWQIIFLLVFNVWSVRLTLNWVIVFTDFTYEDWRYRKYREETSKWFWPVVNFFGIHYMPTVLVFAGMLPLFELANRSIHAMVLPGCAVILGGVALEFFADRQMHAFLQKGEKVTCRAGLWKYTRHPNYLGEMTVWFGVYFAMLPFAPEKWYYGVGAAAMVVLFNVVSIPLMEKRQKARRADYADYCRETSRLLPLPKRLFSKKGEE